MSFDINETIAQMAGAIKGVISEDWPIVKNTVNGFLEDEQSRLELLASLRIKGQINEDDFADRLQNEGLILESELHAIAIITKAVAQRAANAAIDVLTQAVQAAIDII